MSIDRAGDENQMVDEQNTDNRLSVADYHEAIYVEDYDTESEGSNSNENNSRSSFISRNFPQVEDNSRAFSYLSSDSDYVDTQQETSGEFKRTETTVQQIPQNYEELQQNQQNQNQSTENETQIAFEKRLFELQEYEEKLNLKIRECIQNKEYFGLQELRSERKVTQLYIQDLEDQLIQYYNTIQKPNSNKSIQLPQNQYINTTSAPAQQNTTPNQLEEIDYSEDEVVLVNNNSSTNNSNTLQQQQSSNQIQNQQQQPNQKMKKSLSANGLDQSESSNFQDSIDNQPESIQNDEDNQNENIIEEKQQTPAPRKQEPIITPENNYGLPKEYVDILNRVNKEVFNHDAFRGIQFEAIASAIKGNDVFILMPTGGGKSLCYMLTGYVQGGVTVVICPLLSLMKDQVDSLKKMNITAEFINGETPQGDADRIIMEAKTGILRFLYLTPEKLIKGSQIMPLLDVLYENDNFTRLVVDEAHCISQWGHDFRPEYMMIGSVRDKYPNVPVMALTATATPRVIDDIVTNLHMRNYTLHPQTFNRPNLNFEVIEKTDDKRAEQAFGQILEWIINKGYENSCGIIFTISTKETEDVSQYLNSKALKTANYHGKMDMEQRKKTQDLWMNGDIDIIVATLAFGMGINKPNVRFVLHFGIPRSIEGYYQEAGRAGRDGKKSDCCLFFHPRDIQRQSYLLKKDLKVDSQSEFYNHSQDNLNQMVKYAMDKKRCRRCMILKHFGEDFDPSECHNMCDNCRLGSIRGDPIVRDVTQYAMQICNIVSTIYQRRGTTKPHATVKYITKIFFGQPSKNIAACGDATIPEFGVGNAVKTVIDIVDRILIQLCEKRILKKAFRELPAGTVEYYVPGQQFANRGASRFKYEEYPLDKFVDQPHNNEFFKKLNDLRIQVADMSQVDPDKIITIENLKKIVEFKPTTEIELERLTGMTKSVYNKFGKYVIDRILMDSNLSNNASSNDAFSAKYANLISPLPKTNELQQRILREIPNKIAQLNQAPTPPKVIPLWPANQARQPPISIQSSGPPVNPPVPRNPIPVNRTLSNAIIPQNPATKFTPHMNKNQISRIHSEPINSDVVEIQNPSTAFTPPSSTNWVNTRSSPENGNQTENVPQTSDEVLNFIQLQMSKLKKSK